METLQTLGSVLGIGLLSGFRLYATVLVLGLGIRMKWLELSSHLSDLNVLADTKVLMVAGAGFLIEFFADKVPWLDSLWDSVHTLIRPAGAILLASAALGSMDPMVKALVVLLSGGVALASHSSKAATRLAVNHSPEPFSNVALSLAEDLMVPAGLWFVLAHPVATLVILASLVVIFLWLSPKIFRLFRLEMAALGAIFRRWFSSSPPGRLPMPPGAADSEPVSRIWKGMSERITALPAAHFEALARQVKTPPDSGVRCAAAKSFLGLRHSIGYLCLAGDQLLFVTRRWFRWRVSTVELSDISSAFWRRHLLMDQLSIVTRQGPLRFQVFKAAPVRAGKAGLAEAAG